MKHCVGEESQFLEGLCGGEFVASSREVAHDFVAGLDYFVHPTVYFLHLAGWRKVEDEDVSLFVSHLQSAELLLTHLLSLQTFVLGCFEDCDAISSLEVLIFLLFWLFSNAVSYLSIQSLLYLISYLDDFSVFHDAFWQLLQKFLLRRWLEVPIYLRFKRNYGFF